MPRRAIVHIHIPKTAGTTIWDRLSQRFAACDAIMPATPQDAMNADLDRYGLVSGLLAPEHTRRFSLPPFVLACLREPIDRAISGYYFLRASYDVLVAAARTDPVGEPVLRQSEATRRYSIPELISHEPEMSTVIFGNVQARALCDPATVGGLGLVSSAVGVLRQCDVVLLTERLDESFEWLGQRLGCGPLTTRHSNVSQIRKGRDVFDKMTTAALAEMNTADLELYAVASDLHERQVRAWREAGSRPEPTLLWDGPPPASNFQFDQAIHGEGWEPRVQMGTGWCCWIGSTGRAWIDLAAPDTTDCNLACEIRAWLSDSILASAKLTVNEQPVDYNSVRVHDGSILLEAVVPRSAMRRRQGVVRLGFSVSHTARLCDVDPSSLDTRKLGILVGGVRLTPRDSAAAV